VSPHPRVVVPPNNINWGCGLFLGSERIFGSVPLIGGFSPKQFLYKRDGTFFLMESGISSGDPEDFKRGVFFPKRETFYLKISF